MVALRSVGLSSPLARDAKAWIESITMQDDNEDGPDFWRWIVSHYDRNIPVAGNLLDTYFFCGVKDGGVIATASLVHDDRDVGKKYGIEGIWMGGANVRRDLRNRGVMSAGFGQLHVVIQTLVDASGAELAVNLFSGTPAAERIATKAGYLPQRELEIEHFQTHERWYRRTFTPRAR
jgi:hypothetical protein